METIVQRPKLSRLSKRFLLVGWENTKWGACIGWGLLLGCLRYSAFGEYDFCFEWVGDGGEIKDLKIKDLRFKNLRFKI